MRMAAFHWVPLSLALLSCALPAAEKGSTVRIPQPQSEAAANPGKAGTPIATPANPASNPPATIQDPGLIAKPTPVDTSRLTTPVQPDKDSVTAWRFKIVQRPFNRGDAKNFLAAFGFKDPDKGESTLVNWVFRDKKRPATLAYTAMTSEFAFADRSVSHLAPSEFVPDSLIRPKAEALLKSVLRDRATIYPFINFETTMFQKKQLSANEKGRKDSVHSSRDSVLPPVPAYYAGRFIRRLNNRYVLGDGFQVRLGFGKGGAIHHFFYRNPGLSDSTEIRLPTREKVEGMVDEWIRKNPSPKGLVYPYHADNLSVRSLRKVKVFESYIETNEKFSGKSSLDGAYLVPRVTVLVEAKLRPSRKKNALPHPDAPVLLHLHFPCTPGAGLCWPEGKEGFRRGPARSSPPAQSPKSESGPAKPAPATN